MFHRVALSIASVAAFAICESRPIEMSAQEKSVRPGVNKTFEDPNVGEFVERFEKEGRDVFDRRQEVVQALGLKPGMAVADIGAGTGLYSRMFAAQVGEKGQVFAVDISEKFVNHVRETSRARTQEHHRGRLQTGLRRTASRLGRRRVHLRHVPSL